MHTASAPAMMITIYAMEHDGKWRNILTVARSRSGSASHGWKGFSPRKKIKRFFAVFPQAEGEAVLAALTGGTPFSLTLGAVTVRIEYGKLLERSPVFLPNESRKTIASGWWPGTLTDGFWMKMWYSSGRGKVLLLHEQTLEDMREYLGIRLDKLRDYMYSVIQITACENYWPEVSYNPDSGTVVFSLNGEVPRQNHRVVILLGEGVEAVHRVMADLPAGTLSYSQPAPFEPTRLGYELYTFAEEEGCWRLTASKEGTLLRTISLSMGVITGQLKVIEGDTEETFDIVERERQVDLSDEGEKKQPWLQAEIDRIQINRSVVLSELGSLFVRFDGAGSRDHLWNLIRSNIYEPENQYIHIWDPYMDGSILPDMLIHAIRKPQMQIKLLTSENSDSKALQGNGAPAVDEAPEGDPVGGSGTESAGGVGDAVRLEAFPYCKSIVERFEALRAGRSIPNIEARNWYRSGDRVFHDRFLITSQGVWQLGSSLKDLGHYHTTIYRLEGLLPDQVRAEFDRAWKGDFLPMKPAGLELLPAPRILTGMGGGRRV